MYSPFAEGSTIRGRRVFQDEHVFAMEIFMAPKGFWHDGWGPFGAHFCWLSEVYPDFISDSGAVGVDYSRTAEQR